MNKQENNSSNDKTVSSIEIDKDSNQDLLIEESGKQRKRKFSWTPARKAAFDKCVKANQDSKKRPKTESILSPPTPKNKELVTAPPVAVTAPTQIGEEVLLHTPIRQESIQQEVPKISPKDKKLKRRRSRRYERESESESDSENESENSTAEESSDCSDESRPRISKKRKTTRSSRNHQKALLQEIQTLRRSIEKQKQKQQKQKQSQLVKSRQQQQSDSEYSDNEEEGQEHTPQPTPPTPSKSTNTSNSLPGHYRYVPSFRFI